MPLKRRRIIGPSFPFLATPIVASGGGGTDPGGDITTSLIANWPMTDATVSGNTITDVVGSLGVNATKGGSGTMSSIAGPGGFLTTARGTDGAIWASYASQTLRNWFSDAFTVAGWVKFGDSSSGGGGNAQRFWEDDWFGTDTSNHIDLLFDGANLRITLIVDGVITRGPVSSVSVGAWNHFALSNTGGASGTITYYLNGSKPSVSTAGPGGGQFGLVGGLFFSGYTDGSGSMNAGGGLCGCRCYSRVLADVDVATLYFRKT